MGIHPTFEIVGDRHGFFVCKDGAKVSSRVCNRDLAEKTLERLQREARQKTRNCMTCSASFTSEGPHNRLCDSCRSRSLYDGAA